MPTPLPKANAAPAPLWEQLIAGELSIVSRKDSGQDRILVAVRSPKPSPLSPRQKLIVRMLLAGRSQKCMAIELGVSQARLSVEVRNTLEALGFRSALELVVWLAGTPLPARPAGLQQMG